MSDEERKDLRGEPKAWLLLVILAVVAGILWLNWWLLKGDTQRGTFGDMFGGVNALFSGAAFSVLAFTLLLQRYELKLQRVELAETRKVMEAQREQMELQAKTQQLQQFENTFFQLIKGHNDIVQAIDIVRKSDHLTTRGRDCFAVFVNRLKKSNPGAFAGEDFGEIAHAYNDFYRDFEADLGHYFRHLYHVLKFIDQNPQVDQKRYRAFLRAQLSAHELTLLFYNCFSHHGNHLKPLVEKYGMLKHIPPDGPVRQEHALFYDKRAFLPSEGVLV
jgi:uncharacterized membrane protein YeaQ/YmgE (transglycosylase-associated protein family)